MPTLISWRTSSYFSSIDKAIVLRYSAPKVSPSIRWMSSYFRTSSSCSSSPTRHPRAAAAGRFPAAARRARARTAAVSRISAHSAASCAWGSLSLAIPVTSWASTTFRRSSSTDGENPLSSFSFCARSSTERAASPSKSAESSVCKRVQGGPGWWTSHQIRPFSALVTCPRPGSSLLVRAGCLGVTAFGTWAQMESSADASLAGHRLDEQFLHACGPECARRSGALRRRNGPVPRRFADCGRAAARSSR